MILETWEDRKKYLADFQQALLNRFGEENYNVFLFGSILRDDYKPGISDIDLAIYANNLVLRIEIEEFCKDYFEKSMMKSSIIHINLEERYAFVAITPLRLNVCVTDYYPQELKDYLLQLQRRYIWYNEERKMIYHSSNQD